MGLKLEINSVLRSNSFDEVDLVRGERYPFVKNGAGIFFDDAPLWLAKMDWTAMAEISIVEQTLKDGQLSGVFRVDYIYVEAEQKMITDMFVRMYGGLSDPYIYFLIGKAEYVKAKLAGELVRDSLDNEGFLHAAPKAQLNRLAKKHYADTEDLQVMRVDLTKVKNPVKWEPATGGLYPHIYGPLNMDSVVDVSNFT